MSCDRWDSWEVDRENSEASTSESRFSEDLGPGFESERNFLKIPMGKAPGRSE